MNLNPESIIVIIIGILSPLVTLFSAWWQRRNEGKRLSAQNEMDFSSAMENYGTSWNTLRLALEEEIERLRVQSVKREEELLSKLDLVEKRLEEAKNVISSMEENDKIRFEQLHARIQHLEDGVVALVAQVKAYGDTPVFDLEKGE